MTSFIAAGGAGRSTSFIPAVPAAWSVTTIAFMGIVSAVICRLADVRGASPSRAKLGLLSHGRAADNRHSVLGGGKLRDGRKAD